MRFGRSDPFAMSRGLVSRLATLVLHIYSKYLYYDLPIENHRSC